MVLFIKEMWCSIRLLLLLRAEIGFSAVSSSTTHIICCSNGVGEGEITVKVELSFYGKDF